MLENLKEAVQNGKLKTPVPEQREKEIERL